MEWGEIVAGLPEDLRDNATLKNYNSLEDLVKGHIETKKMVGDRIAVPSLDDDEAMGAVFERLGRPKTAEEYKLPEVKLPEGVKFNEDETKEFVATAHKLGITQKQVEGLYQWYGGNVTKGFSASNEAHQEALEKGEKELRAKWGQAYNRNKKAIEGMFNSFGGDHAQDLIDQYGTDPRMLMMLGNIKGVLSEDTLDLIGDPKSPDMTPAEAKAAADAIMGDKDSGYWSKDHKGHDAAVKKVNELLKIANAGSK